MSTSFGTETAVVTHNKNIVFMKKSGKNVAKNIDYYRFQEKDNILWERQRI